MSMALVDRNCTRTWRDGSTICSPSYCPAVLPLMPNALHITSLIGTRAKPKANIANTRISRRVTRRLSGIESAMTVTRGEHQQCARGLAPDDGLTANEGVD